MKIKLEENAIMPRRMHPDDAGMDLFTPCDFVLHRGEIKTIPTGVHIRFDANTYGRIESKSGLFSKHGVLTVGTIDEGYTGNIGVMMANIGNEDLEFFRGDKISQLVICPVVYPHIKQVDELEETERGANGFGSTGT